MAEANRAERHAWVERCAAAARNPGGPKDSKAGTCTGLLAARTGLLTFPCVFYFLFASFGLCFTFSTFARNLIMWKFSSLNSVKQNLVLAMLLFCLNDLLPHSHSRWQKNLSAHG